MGPLFVWWIGAGDADEALLLEVRANVAAAFDLPVRAWAAPDRPSGTLDPRRQQHSSTQILRWLMSRRPAAAGKVLAITDVDLFIPVLTFVFGEAQFGGAVALVSVARLAAGSRPESEARRRLAERLSKEAVHEIGHTFGLVHCDEATCGMARSPNIQAVDRKTNQLCADCRLAFLERLTTREDMS